MSKDGIKNGDVVLLNRIKGGFFSTAQRFFTKHSFTHCAIGIGEIRNEHSVISADELVCVLPTKNYYYEKNTDMLVYELIDFDKKVVDTVIDKLYSDYAGSLYGFLQVFWFVYRWLLEFLKINVKRQHNPLANGQICSELVYRFLWEISFDKYDVREYMLQYTANTCNVADISDILKSFPNHFKLKEVIWGAK